MTRTKPDLSPFDRVETPDLWDRIVHLDPRQPLETLPVDRRIGTIALALSVSIVAIGFLALAYFRSEPKPAQPVPSPSGTSAESTLQVAASIDLIVDTGLGFPEGAVIDEQGVWVAVNAGDVVGGDLLRIDKQTGAIKDRVALPTLPGWDFGGGGITSGLGSIWLTASGRELGHTATVVYRVDPVSATLVETIDVGDGSPADIWVDETGIWVLSFAETGREMWLYELDPVTHVVLGRHTIPASWANTVAAAGGALWVLGSTDDANGAQPETLFRVDPTDGSILDRFSLAGGENFAIAPSADRIWFFARGGLRALDATNGQEIVGPLSLPDVCCAGLVPDEVGGVWVVNGSGGEDAERGVWHVGREGAIEERSKGTPGREADGIAAAFDQTTNSIWIIHYERTVARLTISMPSSEPWNAAGPGWTELPAPPLALRGAALVWTGDQLILFGGTGDYEATASVAAFAFDPTVGSWSRLPDPPSATWGSQGFWTGTEALFWGGQDPSDALGGVAFDPSTQTWRTIAPAPLDPGWGGQGVWTGEELIIFGGGIHVGDPRNTQAAAYDPASDTWRRLPDAPTGLNRLSGTWTGREAVFLGSLQTVNGVPQAEEALGVAYDPTLNAWRPLATSPLNPQAVSIVALSDGGLFVWDYLRSGSTYDSGSATWSDPIEIPLRESECWPQTVVVGETIFAWYCSQAATSDASARSWKVVHGGIASETVETGDGSLALFQTATLAAAGDVVALVGEGITIQDGTPCFGCPNSPAAFWVYRP
jgi:hypothetical protein